MYATLRTCDTVKLPTKPTNVCNTEDL